MSIVSFSWLQSHIDLPDSKVILLETAWIDRNEGYTNYLKKHIPGANFFDMWVGVNSTHTRPRELPNVDEFEKHAQSLGVNSDSHVVIYDQGKVSYAVRLWFTFEAFGLDNVSVLDGGKVFWEQQNLPMQSGEPVIPQKIGNIQLRPNTTKFLDYNELIKRTEKQDVQLIDTRHPDYFQGTKHDLPPELISTLKWTGLNLDPNSLHKGHLPGAVNLHYPQFTDPDTRCFITKEKLIKLMDETGIDINKPIIGTCYLGVTACFIPLTMSALLDKQDNIQVYLGSWTEYSQTAPKEKIETGVSKKSTS